MKTNKPNYYNDILSYLKELKTLFPDYSMGKHLSTIIDEYGDIWGITDKELAYALKKYKAQLEMYVPTHAEDIDEIIKDGLNLSTASLTQEED